MTNEDFLEMSSELAGAIVENTLGGDVWEIDVCGEDWRGECYNAGAQDLFNQTIDIIQEKLLNHLEVTNLPYTACLHKKL